MGIVTCRKIAASGARLVSLSWWEVECAAHHGRAVVLPGLVEVLPLASRSLVVVDPRPRALESSAGLKCMAARSWRAVVLQGAGGSTSSLAVVFRCRAALTRAGSRFIVGLSYSRARLAGGRTFGRLARSNPQERSVRIHGGRQTISNYAFKPIAEQALRSNQTIVPQRLNAALDFL